MPSRSTTYSSSASDSKEVSSSEEVSWSKEAYAPATISQSATSDEVDSADSTPAPLTGVLAPVDDQPNQWCVQGQFQVYTDTKLPNDEGVMTRTLTLERRVLTGSLVTTLSIHALFTKYLYPIK